MKSAEELTADLDASEQENARLWHENRGLRKDYDKVTKELRRLDKGHLGCDDYWSGMECLPCQTALGPAYEDSL